MVMRIGICGWVIDKKKILFRAGLVGVFIVEVITWRDDGVTVMTPEDFPPAVRQVPRIVCIEPLISVSIVL